MAEFMVLLRGSDPELKRMSREESSQLMERYYEWVDHLKRADHFRGGAPVKESTKLLSGKRDLVVIQDGPYRRHGEAVSGYFVIEAASFSDAVEIAKTCPALTHGESVEVLEMDL